MLLHVHICWFGIHLLFPKLCCIMSTCYCRRAEIITSYVFCLTDGVAVTSGVAEVMSLVTGLAADAEASSQEVTGPTDPIRVIVTHTLQPDSSSITFSIELLSRLTADIKGLVLRYYVTMYTVPGRENQSIDCISETGLDGGLPLVLSVLPAMSVCTCYGQQSLKDYVPSCIVGYMGI